MSRPDQEMEDKALYCIFSLMMRLSRGVYFHWTVHPEHPKIVRLFEEFDGTLQANHWCWLSRQSGRWGSFLWILVWCWSGCLIGIHSWQCVAVWVGILEGNLENLSDKIISLLGLYWIIFSYFCIQRSILCGWGDAVCIGLCCIILRGVCYLYGDMPSIGEGMILSRWKHTDKHSLLVLAFLVLVFVKIFLANAIEGHPVAELCLAVFACIGQDGYELLPVVVSEGSSEKSGAYPGFYLLKHSICWWVLVPIDDLCSEEYCFVWKIRDKLLEIISKAKKMIVISPGWQKLGGLARLVPSKGQILCCVWWRLLHKRSILYSWIQDCCILHFY